MRERRRKEKKNSKQTQDSGSSAHWSSLLVVTYIPHLHTYLLVVCRFHSVGWEGRVSVVRFDFTSQHTHTHTHTTQDRTMASYHMRGAGPVYSGYEEMERPSYEIRDVWESNLEEEMAVIREIIQEYPFVAMVSLQLWKCELLEWEWERRLCTCVCVCVCVCTSYISCMCNQLSLFIIIG
jgi:hypothetical protein